MKHFYALIYIFVSTAFSVVGQDTLFYENKKVSSITSNWIDGRRTVKFYDLSGKETYRIEEVNLSYHHIATLKQRKDGSISEIELSAHPGGGINWTKSLIRLDNQNYPVSMEVVYFPTQLSKPTAHFKWAKQTNKWIDAIGFQPELTK